MYRVLIKNYISNLTPIQVKQFAKEKHVELTDQEVIYFTNFIKKNWQTLLYQNEENLFKEVRANVRPEIFELAKKEFIQAKNKYQSFL